MNAAAERDAPIPTFRRKQGKGSVDAGFPPQSRGKPGRIPAAPHLRSRTASSPPPPHGGGLGRGQGFTLIELVVALTISAILVGFIAMLITMPVDAYFEQAERARLTESTQVISRVFASDLRTALPNSVRIRNSGSRSIVEFLRTSGAPSIYRPTGTTAASPDASKELDFDTLGDEFILLGELPSIGSADASGARPIGYLALNNYGAGHDERDAYRLGSGLRVMTPTQVTSILDDGIEHVELPPGFGFISPDPATTPLNRIFAVSGPVAYICNTATGTLNKYEGYSIGEDMPSSESDSRFNDSDVQASTLATNVSSCELRCAGGGDDVEVCQDVLVLEIAVARSSEDREVIRLLEEVPLDNRL